MTLPREGMDPDVFSFVPDSCHSDWLSVSRNRTHWSFDGKYLGFEGHTFRHRPMVWVDQPDGTRVLVPSEQVDPPYAVVWCMATDRASGLGMEVVVRKLDGQFTATINFERPDLDPPYSYVAPFAVAQSQSNNSQNFSRPQFSLNVELMASSEGLYPGQWLATIDETVYQLQVECRLLR